MKKMIMLLTNSFLPDVRVYKEALYAKQCGYDITILCWEKRPGEGRPLEETIGGVNIVRFPIPSVIGTGKKQIPAYLKYIRACRAYLKQHPCTLLHGSDLDGAIAVRLSRQHGTPYIFDMHEYYERGSKLKRFFIRMCVILLIRGSVAALYENDAYLHARYASVRNKLYSLKNYPDAGMIKQLPKTNSDVFRIGYHGVAREQLQEFTALFEAVKDMPDVRVDINGMGTDYPALKELEKQYRNVYIHGAYDGSRQSSRLYADTDVLFCGYDPNDPNYQGDAEVIKFFEAIRTGTPMLMTRGIGMGDKVVKNGFGFAVNTRDTGEIRDAIAALKNDRALWRRFSDNELAQAPQYDWNAQVSCLKRILSENS